MKKKHKKSSGVKASGSGQSAENNTDKLSDFPVIEPGENKIVRNIVIYNDTDINDLQQQVIDESHELEPRDIMYHVICAKQFPLKKIEDLGKTISKSNLIVDVNAVGKIDFIEFAFFALCVTGKVNFLEGCKIEMNSLSPIPKNVLKRISKKISKRTGVDAKVISKFYKDKAIVDPWDLFSE